MFIFAKIGPVRTIVTHRQTDREMNKAMARSEIEDMPNNIREFYTAPQRIISITAQILQIKMRSNMRANNSMANV